MALFTTAPRSICILRLSAIGDVCNAIAAVQAIQRAWPSTQITWVTGQLEAQLVQSLPNIRVVVFDKKLGWRAYTQLWRALANQRFDALLHLQYAMRANIATLGIKARYKLGFDKARSQDFQTWFTNVKVPSPTAWHVLDGFLEFVRTLGINDIEPKWLLTYSKEDRLWANDQILNDNRNLIVVPAASKAYKNWTVQGYIDVIEHAQQRGWNIILAGSPAKLEIDLAQQITSNLKKPVHNLVGKSSLMQMLALLDQADLVIAPDTGPAHMANAMNTPVIGLYAHHNPERTGPYHYRHYVVSVYQQAIEAQTGKPITELDWRTRVKDPDAMAQIHSADVIEMFDNVVADFSL